MLDTNICIYISKRKPPQVSIRFDQVDAGEAVVSVITYGELRAGAQKSSNMPEAVRRLENFTHDVPVVPLDKAVVPHYAKLRADLQRGGTPIGGNDMWIAAHCLHLGLTLVTNNMREFSRVPGLALENWIETS